MRLRLARHVVGLLFVAPVPASAPNVWDTSLFATKLSTSDFVSYQINRALLHSPVIEGLTNLTKLSFHCGGGGGGWWYSCCWPILSSHRRIAKFSRLSGLKACAAASRKGTARAARLVHTHVFAKLAAAIARQKKQQQCRRFTWQFAFKIFKLLPSNHELRSLLCMSMDEDCIIWPPRNKIVTQLFHSFIHSFILSTAGMNFGLKITPSPKFWFHAWGQA